MLQHILVFILNINSYNTYPNRIFMKRGVTYASTKLPIIITSEKKDAEIEYLVNSDKKLNFAPGLVLFVIIFKAKFIDNVDKAITPGITKIFCGSIVKIEKTNPLKPSSFIKKPTLKPTINPLKATMKIIRGSPITVIPKIQIKIIVCRLFIKECFSKVKLSIFSWFNTFKKESKKLIKFWLCSLPNAFIVIAPAEIPTININTKRKYNIKLSLIFL